MSMFIATTGPGLPKVAYKAGATKTQIESATDKRRQALEEIYAASAEQIYKFVYGKVGNREDAEDITSQVFIKAATWLDVEQDDRQQLAWLYQVARTTTNDYWRRFYSQPALSLEVLEEGGAFDPPGEPLCLSEDESTDQEGTLETVACVLSWLPEKYRLVLQLRFLKGYSMQQTATEMGVTECNARVLQHRALRKAAKLESVLNKPPR